MSIAYLNSKSLNPTLRKSIREDKFDFFGGCLGINLMKINSESDNSQFYNTMCSYYFTPLLLQPTRVTDKSKTLTDNIFFNSFEFSTLSGNITHSISDLYKRNFEKFDNNKLKEDLLKIDWINEILKNGDGIKEIFATFYKSLNEIVDRHAPLTKATKKALDK